MAHLHELIDFTVAAFVVYNRCVVLVFHKKLRKWLPLGGHIELDEDPEQALFREVREESGLEIKVMAEKPAGFFAGKKFLYPPTFLDVHPITATHRHIGLVYFARAQSDRLVLAVDEHDAIRWFTEGELADPVFNVPDDIRFYAREALHRAGMEK